MGRLLLLSAGLLAASVSDAAVSGEVKIDGGHYTLNGDIEIADDKQLSDGVVLMVHGTLGHKDMEVIASLQTALLDAGYTSLAVNLSLNIDDRHGFYPCESRHSHRDEDALRELQLWVNWLLEQQVQDIVLLGHSRGANQVAKYIRQNGVSPRAAILLAPSATNARPDEAMIKAIQRDGVNAWFEDVDFLHCKNAVVKGTTFLSYLGSNATGDTVPYIASASIPTLVISGSEDAAMDGLEYRMSEIENDLIDYVRIEGAGHFFRDLYGLDVVDEIVDFLISDE